MGEEMNVKVVNQSKISEECWSVQIWGFSACTHCEYKGKKDCGGKSIRKTQKNSKGFTVTDAGLK